MNADELNPCPQCGSADVKYFYYDDEVSVYCKNCQFKITPHRLENFAAESWNSLPRHLQWTNETPTKEGHYWFRTIEDPDTGTTGPTDMVYYCPGSDIVRNLPDGMWAGPIPAPKEPK